MFTNLFSLTLRNFTFLTTVVYFYCTGSTNKTHTALIYYSFVFLARLNVQSIAVTVCIAKFNTLYMQCNCTVAVYNMRFVHYYFYNEQRWFPCAALNYSYL